MAMFAGTGAMNGSNATAAPPKPASAYLRQTGSHQDHDPAADIPGMPPNMGENLLPHVTTFQGILSSVSRVYRPSDEAIKHSFDNARFMLNDPVITECIDQRRRSVALLNWHLEPEDDRDPKQKELADQITQIIKRIPHFKKYRETMQWATWYGRYGIQHRYRWKNVRGAQRICVDQWLPVHGDKIVFRYDDGQQEFDPNQIGIRVGAGYQTSHSVQKKWPTERLDKVQPTDYGLAYFLEEWERPQILVHKYMIEDGEYEDPMNAGRIHGVGIRSRLYWAWYQKQETLAWLMEYLERSALGMEIWFYPWGNPNARDEMMKAAQERIGQGRNIVLVPKPVGEPDLYGVERIEPGMAGAEVLERIVKEYWGHLMKRYILGQTMTTESANSGLGSNLGEIHLDTYMQIIRSDAIDAEETLTTDLVDPLKIFNRPDMASVPLYFRIDTEAPDVEKKLSAWKDTYDMGLELVEQSVRDLIGAPKPEPGDAVLSKAQDAAEDHDRQMQLAQAAGQPGMQSGMPGGAQAAGMGQYPAGFKGRSQGAMPGQDFQEFWKALKRQQEVDALQEAVGAKPSNGGKSRYGRQPEPLDNPPSENSERERLAVYAAGETDGADLTNQLAVAFARRGMPEKYRKDASGHEHKGHGPGGGQFTSSAAGGSQAEATAAKRRPSRGELSPAKREGKGKDARIVLADGDPAPPHIKPSLVPPQWTDVHVSIDPAADVLVRARDAKGRIKTVYSDSFTMRQAAAKFARVSELVSKQHAISQQNQANRHSEDAKTREAADCLWLIEEQGTRPGSDGDTKAKVKAYGATTLRAEHVIDEGQGRVRLDFIGKEGVHHNHLVRSAALAAMLLERKASAASRGGRLFGTTDAALRDYTRSLDGGDFTPKDFRTAKATMLATDEMHKIGGCCRDKKEYKAAVKQVATAVSSVLGNRPQQAVESYINPVVWSAWRCPDCA